MSQHAATLGAKLLDSTKARIGAAWETYEATAREDLEAATQDLGDLLSRAMLGEDVEAEVELVRGTILDWQFVGSAAARSALLETLREVASVAGAIISGLVSGLL